MTESQRIVMNWRAKLKEMGWPEDAVRSVISELCEAGYRQCIDDIQARSEQKERIIASATSGIVQ
jgi:hypothetical protein